MFRLLRNLLILAVLAGIAALAFTVYHLPDPSYTVQEWMKRDQFGKYDQLISDAGTKYGLDPMLVKALVWRESKFQPDKVGTSGERGLMQVGEAAARDWARVSKVEDFEPTDLFDPKVNLDAGAWYLAKAGERWKGKADPVPFMLAEYNAGRTRVDRWIKESGKGDTAESTDLLQWIDFKTTRKYIDDIVARWRFYKERGRM